MDFLLIYKEPQQLLARAVSGFHLSAFAQKKYFFPEIKPKKKIYIFL